MPNVEAIKFSCSPSVFSFISWSIGLILQVYTTMHNGSISSFFPVKCIKNTPAYFAERLHKAMAVCLFLIITFCFVFFLLVTRQSFPAPIICDVFTGRRDQGQNPDPYHGNTLWGWHVGHQTGVSEEVRKVSVHSHLGKSSQSCYYDNYTQTYYFHLFIKLYDYCVSQGDTSGDYKKLLLKLCGGSDWKEKKKIP